MSKCKRKQGGHLQGIHEKGSGDVVSAVCVQRYRYMYTVLYIVYQAAETTSTEPVS